MEIIESPSDKSLPTKPSIEESLLRLKGMTEVTPENTFQIIKTIAISEITPELVKAIKDIPEIQSASLSIKTTLTQLPFYTEMIKTNPEINKPLNALVANIGLIAEYSLSNPEAKPPFTNNQSTSGWDLEQYQIDEFKKALSPEALEVAKKIIDEPNSFEQVKGDLPLEQIIVAISYQKVLSAESSAV